MIGINLYKMKKCYKCKKLLSLNNFCRDRSRKDGLAYRCNECRREYDRANKEKIKEYSKKYYEENREREIKRSKKYRENNQEKYRTTHKKYRDNNKEKIEEYNKKWRENNKEYYKNEKIKEQRKAYYKDNKDLIAEQNKKWQENNRDKVKEIQRRYRDNNKEKIKERIKKFRATNRDKRREEKRRRRALKISVNENYTKDHEKATMLAFNYKCHNCGKISDLCIDHHRPLLSGNALTLLNAVVLCRSCNSSKGTNIPEQFYDQVKLINANFKMNLSTFIYKDL